MEAKENKCKCSECIYFDVTTGWAGTDDGCCKRLGMNKLIIFDSKKNQFISFNKDSVSGKILNLILFLNKSKNFIEDSTISIDGTPLALTKVNNIGTLFFSPE